MGTHWVSGAWTNPGQKGDADHWRLDTWKDDLNGTITEVERLTGHDRPVFFGGDLNTPKEHLPTLLPGQDTLHNTAGYDKLIHFPAGEYDVTFGPVDSIATPSDHDLIVVPVTLTLDGTEVLTFRFGTCNVKHTMTAADKRKTIEIAFAHCDAVVWQETDDPMANALIDGVFPPADWWHLFPELETDISLRRSMFDVIGTHSKRISTGRESVSPHRYVADASANPILQK